MIKVEEEILGAFPIEMPKELYTLLGKWGEGVMRQKEKEQAKQQDKQQDKQVRPSRPPNGVGTYNNIPMSLPSWPDMATMLDAGYKGYRHPIVLKFE